MKNEVFSELNYCKDALKKELKRLSTYQSEFLDWINNQKTVVAQMKENGIPTSEYADIIDFCGLRNRFLCKKMLQIDSYLLSIKKMSSYLGGLDEIVDAAEIEGIDTQLRFMMASLGFLVIEETFGKEF